MRASGTRHEVPFTIRMVAWFYVITGALALAASFTYVRGAGLLYVALAVFQLIVGWGLLNAAIWSYGVAVALALAHIATGLLWGLLGVPILLLPMIVNALVLFALLSRESRDWARSRRGVPG